MNAISACEGCNGYCCYHYVVPVTGYDAYRIATTQRLSMEQFLVYIPEDEPTSSGFVLDRSETTYSLALNKQNIQEQQSPCIFLMIFPDGVGRCGIYSHRPLVCQTYPTTLHNGSVDIREDAICPTGSWNIAALHLPRWRERLLRMEMETTIYGEVVRCWNSIVHARGPETTYSILQYFAFLINAYYRLDRLRMSLSSDEQQHLVNTWGRQVAEPGDRTAATWSGFMNKVEQILTGFVVGNEMEQVHGT